MTGAVALAVVLGTAGGAGGAGAQLIDPEPTTTTEVPVETTTTEAPEEPTTTDAPRQTTTTRSTPTTQRATTTTEAFEEDLTEEEVETETEVTEPEQTTTTGRDLLVPGDGSDGAESTTTTSTTIAEVAADGGIDEETQIWLVVAGLVVVALLIGVWTVRYWRRTRPDVPPREPDQTTVFGPT